MHETISGKIIARDGPPRRRRRARLTAKKQLSRVFFNNRLHYYLDRNQLKDSNYDRQASATRVLRQTAKNNNYFKRYRVTKLVVISRKNV